MEDYGEQRDEWQTLLTMENGKVKSFRHSNGKTFYCEQIDDYKVDPTIEETLKGKTIEKKMDYYYVTESVRLYETAYGEITKERLNEKAVHLSEYDGIIKLLLKDDILVGATVKGYFKDGNLLLDRCVCTYYAYDNEGSGTKDREDYVYLIFYKD
ncbi:MAG: hypothetical protein PUB20_03220 [Clostridia bacterium]|nr:hypothetical protein [Clostridia bacterium]